MESNRLLDLRDVSLTTMQACILLGAFSVTWGEAPAESVYYCVACRIANLLDLANRPCSDAIEREVNIRGKCQSSETHASILFYGNLLHDLDSTDCCSLALALYD
jgi:hypothetical protein